MLNYKRAILFSLFVSVFLISAVSAEDDVDVSDISIFCENHNPLKLQGNISLDRDYELNVTDNDLNISGNLQINGNGHVMDFDNLKSVSITDNSSIVFENITFKNINHLIMSKNISNFNLTFKNCKFKLDSTDLIYLNHNSNDTISFQVKILAKSIVGNLKGIDACKKLSKWVGKNIVHESREGFYQSPLDTILRKRGNCCSQTELFLQMCDAVGALKNHKAYFVHVGTMKFGQRHFFAKIDNVYVDVDSRPENPWGHANFNGRSIYKITSYPKLPLVKEY